MKIDARLKELGAQPIHGSQFLSVNEEELINLEQSLHVRLPETYRNFLMKYGAACFAYILMFRPVQLLSTELPSLEGAYFSHFYGSKNERHQAHSLQWAIEILAERLPENLIPIGNDGGDNHICLGIRGTEHGKIYFWDHEQEYLGPQNAHLVAESFEDFLDRLYVAAE